MWSSAAPRACWARPSVEFDPDDSGPKGVNIVLIDPAGKPPAVSLTLRNLPLKRVLDLIADAAGYQYEVQADAVVLRPGGEVTALETAYFPLSRSTVIRTTGLGAAARGDAREGGRRPGRPRHPRRKTRPPRSRRSAAGGREL